MTIIDKEIEQILEDEGFERKPYQCSEGVWTIGHGLTFITEEESGCILKYFRLPSIFARLKSRQPWIASAHPEVQAVCLNMAFQLGVTGLSKFSNFIDALKVQDYNVAATHMLDSKWAKQTPNRANRLADRIRAL